MCIRLLEDSGKHWLLIAAFHKWSRACARLRFGLSQPWEEHFTTQSSRGCQGGLGFCGWQPGHRSCLQDTLMHGCRVSFRDALHACSRGSGAGVHAPMYGLVIPGLGRLGLGMPKASLMVAGAAATHRRNAEPWQS